MLLVFIFAIVLMIIFFVLSCNLRIYINITDNGYKIDISIYALKRISVYKMSFLIKRQKLKIDRRNIIKIVKSLNIRAEEINAKIYIGTSEVQSTALISGILNSIISIFITSLNIKINKDTFKYKVVPIYSNKKVLHIKIKCILSCSLVHIISTFIKLKIGDVKYGRGSSNRRAYGYRYE